jgi:hypothetical protein
MSILDLEIAVLNKDKDAVQKIIAEIDRRTENEMFQKAGEHFGFKTVEANGRRIAFRAELAAVFGYSDESGLRKLTEKYRLESFQIGGFGQEVRNLLMQEFNISKFAGRAVFVCWQTFLIAGIDSITTQAEEVKRYLLQMERAGRIAAGSRDIASAKNARIVQGEKVVAMVSKADRIADKHLRHQTLLYIDDIVDGALNVPKQLDLFGNKNGEESAGLPRLDSEK